MDIVKKKISDLRVVEKNVRRHPQRQLDEMKRSFSMFGQYRPLVVTSDGVVLVGNGFFEAMKQEDESREVDCIVLPSNVSESYKKKLMLADNKIFDLGADAMSNIDEILQSIDDFNIPGYDEEVLSQLYAEVEEEVKSIESTSVAGIIPSERIDNIKKVEEQRKENPPSDNADKYEVKQEVIKMQDEHEGEPYITCPHCGVKIYGYN